MRSKHSPLTQISDNLWVIGYELNTLGVDMRRNVTLIRLASGMVIIHSSAPFTGQDVLLISSVGKPGWLVDTLLRHDTFTREAKAALPDVPYLAPPGFSEPARPILPPPTEWEGEVDVLEVAGAPKFGEYVMLHRASRTLIVADLIINFPQPSWWGKFLLSLATAGGKREPGMTKPFLAAIEDKAAFAESMHILLEWDFDRIIVGHGDRIERGGKAALTTVLRELGFVA